MSKRILENCNAIKAAIILGIGTPNQYEGKCDGYDVEPICKECKLNTMHENFTKEWK